MKFLYGDVAKVTAEGFFKGCVGTVIRYDVEKKENPLPEYMTMGLPRHRWPEPTYSTKTFFAVRFAHAGEQRTELFPEESLENVTA